MISRLFSQGDKPSLFAWDIPGFSTESPTSEKNLSVSLSWTAGHPSRTGILLNNTNGKGYDNEYCDQ